MRAGGKHNDLDNVGYTARHHTFFEMLGNFSFGDYFKAEAIEFAWELVTKHFGLPKEQLAGHRLSRRRRSGAVCGRKSRAFRMIKIIRIKTSMRISGAWAISGPAGHARKSSSIRATRLQGGPPGSPDEDGDRFLEFWNLVFMQFEQAAGGTRMPLPKPSIDTGMGLERITAILQGVHSDLRHRSVPASDRGLRRC